MKNNSKWLAKTKLFFKKNGYYVLLGVSILAIGVMIAFAVGSSDTSYEAVETVTPTVTPTVEPTTEPEAESEAETDADVSIDIDVDAEVDADVSASVVTVLVPVANATIGTDYVMDGFVFSATLNQWQTHSGIDFLTDGAEDVMACADGVVTSVVTNDILNGGVVTISHDGGLESTYMSLASDIYVSVGDTVCAGDVIGQTSQTAYADFLEGTHVHFEMKLNGEYVDPNDYFAK